MYEQTASEILAAVKSALESIDLKLVQVADKVRAKREKERLSDINGVWKRPPRPTVQTAAIKRIGDIDWEAVKTAILAEKEPSPLEKEIQLRLIKAGPHLFQSAILDCIKQLNCRPGGHPRVLTTEQELAACNLVERYRIEEHMNTPAAIDRVAIELNWKNHVVSPRTLRRRYDEYIKRKKLKD